MSCCAAAAAAAAAAATPTMSCKQPPELLQKNFAAACYQLVLHQCNLRQADVAACITLMCLPH
jgi:hypothetical protein